jgi:hypothetical protein
MRPCYSWNGLMTNVLKRVGLVNKLMHSYAKFQVYEPTKPFVNFTQLHFSIPNRIIQKSPFIYALCWPSNS